MEKKLKVPFEKYSRVGNSAIEGLLVGLIIGCTWGFLETFLVTITGFNVPLTYVLFVFSFDLLIGSIMGVFWGVISTIFMTTKINFFNGKFDKSTFSICIIFTGTIYCQGMFLQIVRGTNGFYVNLMSLLSIALFFSFYKLLKIKMIYKRSFSIISFILLTIFVEILIIFGDYINRESHLGFFEFKSIVRNMIFVIITIVTYLVIETLLSRFMKAKLTTNFLVNSRKTTSIFVFSTFVISIIVLFVIQPRFPLTPENEKKISKIVKTESNKNFNIILISIDTLRSDHLGSYGYSKKISPNIDKLAEEGTLFKYAYSQSSWTLPSYGSLMTSLYPSQHGAYKPFTKIGKNFPMLAELLKKESYVTAAFTGGGWISRWHGFEKGFQVFDERAEHRLNLNYKPIISLLGVPLVNDQRSLSLLLPKVIDWLRINYRKKFFMFIHSYEVHDYFHNDIKLKPYLKKLGYEYDKNLKDLALGQFDMGNNLIKRVLNANKYELRYIKGLYDAKIMYTDDLLNKLFVELKDLGIEKNTLIIFTSDHGEGFSKELKRIHHGGRLHNDQILVPLIFKLPGYIPRNQVIYDPVELIDVLPTLLDLLNIPKPKKIQGNSFVGEIFKNKIKQDRIIFSEELGYKFNEHNMREPIKGSYRIVSAIFKDLKYIRSPEGNELYNIKNDPGEKKNLLIDGLEPTGNFQEKIEEFIRANKPIVNNKKDNYQKKINLNRENVENLRSLGYVK